jgi:hypothetical protein
MMSKDTPMSMIDPKGSHPSGLRYKETTPTPVAPKKAKAISPEIKQKQDAAIRFLRENGPHS